MPRKKIDALVEVAKTYGAKGLAYLAVNEDGTYKSSFAKFFEEEQLKELVKAMDGEPGDLLLFAADKKKVVWDVLGALRLHLAKSLDLLKKTISVSCGLRSSHCLSGPKNKIVSLPCIIRLPCRWKKTSIRSTAIRE